MSRGTSNTNARGGTPRRRRRREWLIETFRADCDATPDVFGGWRWAPRGTGIPACRCYRCGCLLTVDTVSADRIIPGIEGGTYKRANIRPSCLLCQSKTGTEIRERRRLGRAS